jgi:hypothetical protein
VEVNTSRSYHNINRQSHLQVVEVPSSLRGSVDVLASDEYFHISSMLACGSHPCNLSRNLRRFTLLVINKVNDFLD